MSSPEPLNRYEVRAAGAIVRRGDGPGTEVLVIHRPGREDWSLPKGKLAAGETEADAAMREVLEETGCEIRLVQEAGTTEYADRKDRSKLVTWWIADVVQDHGFAPTDEVDERRWLAIPEAMDLLTYARDRDLLDRAIPTRAGR
jgi:8-oxo-dGTP diphosphatase